MAKQTLQQRPQLGGQHGVSGGGHKKQVRRRLHTSRPYQERLLNMAEARKEIVTALKFHRAAMKQANERKQQLHHHQFTVAAAVNHHQQLQNQKITTFGMGSSYFTNTPHNNYSSYNNNNNNNYPWNISCLPINCHETLNIKLPDQTLGLNLNLQAFTNLDSNFTTRSAAPNKTPSSSSSSSTAEGCSTERAPAVSKEIRSIGEKQEKEWDDTLNLMEFPALFTANEGFLQQPLDDYSPQDYCIDTTLPWMDIGDIEGMDDEWLS